MKTRTIFRTYLVAASLSLAGWAGQMHAGDFEADYSAQLSDRDHFNSSGERLRSVSEILRQDRANFHKKGGDPGDSGDQGTFDTNGKRGRFDGSKIELDGISSSEIINGTPRVKVLVAGDSVVVSRD